MRTSTAVAVLVISGFAWIGVPSAAADELPPTPAETSAVIALLEEPVAAPTPEPSDVPTSDGSEPEPDASTGATEDSAEVTDGETADPTDGVTGEPSEAGNQTPPAEGETPLVDEGGSTGLTESDESTEALAATGGEVPPLSSQAVTEPVLDPWASIGDLDCADLTIPVTLDNSRSTGTVAFVVLAAENINAEEVEALYEETFVLAAGARQVVRVPVVDGMPVDMEVRAFDPSREGLENQMAYSFMRVICMVDEPRANIGQLDCSAFTVPVILDNSRSPSRTTFWVAYYLSLEDEDIESQEPFAVEAGETRVVQIAVTQDSWLDVLVSLAKDWDASDVLANEYTSVDCAPREGITTVTTATIGDPDCRTRTFPVTIDNSDVTERRGVEVNAEWGPPRYDVYIEWFYAAPNATRIVRVPIPQSIDEMFAYVFSLEAQATLDDGLLAERRMHMNCPRTAARPTVAVEGAKLPQTGGFNLAVPLLGVALLTGGAGALALSGRRRQF